MATKPINKSRLRFMNAPAPPRRPGRLAPFHHPWMRDKFYGTLEFRNSRVRSSPTLFPFYCLTRKDGHFPSARCCFTGRWSWRRKRRHYWRCFRSTGSSPRQSPESRPASPHIPRCPVLLPLAITGGQHSSCYPLRKHGLGEPTPSAAIYSTVRDLLCFKIKRLQGTDAFP